MSGSQFRILFDEAVKCFSEALLIVDDLIVRFTADRNANPFGWLCRFCLGLGTMSLRHIG